MTTNRISKQLARIDRLATASAGHGPSGKGKKATPFALAKARAFIEHGMAPPDAFIALRADGSIMVRWDETGGAVLVTFKGDTPWI